MCNGFRGSFDVGYRSCSDRCRVGIRNVRLCTVSVSSNEVAVVVVLIYIHRHI